MPEPTTPPSPPVQSNLPVPDPTTLTTDQLRREIAALRELLEGRLDAMDRAVRLASKQLAKTPDDAHQARNRLRAEWDQREKAEREFLMAQIDIAKAETARVGDVAQEKFAAIDGTFQSNALALTAALAAQKEAAAEQNRSNTLAITKSEQAAKETASSDRAQTQSGIASLATVNADLKERLVRIETSGVVGATAHSERRLDTGQVLSYLLLAAAIIGLVLSVVLKP